MRTDEGDVYRRAARVIEQRREFYSCHALDRVGADDTDYRRAFGCKDGTGLSDPTDTWVLPDDAMALCSLFFNEAGGRRFRALALYFMAAMADAGDLP